MQAYWIIGGFGLVALASLLVAPKRATVEGFFQGQIGGASPGLWTLVLSQVTTWIFARSLMNSAILGYFYGMAGTMAYAAYYLSFLTGGYVVGHLRGAGAGSVQDWLAAHFGGTGTKCYNVVIALRLLSEVFANLLVIGLVIGALMPDVVNAPRAAILLVSILGLAYSAWGGLSAALRTDVLQMLVFIVVFTVAFIALIFQPDFSLAKIVSSTGTSGSYNGWILMAVAALQVFSYPIHDPVMMDRGFLADERITKASFLHAFWISSLFIIGFGMFGIQAGLMGAEYQGELLGTWAAIFPQGIFIALMLSLLISALSTLDSALASAARLTVEELKILPRSLAGGRLAMVVFMVLGAALTLWGNSSLFDAVAVSGTASMFLTPILLVGLIFGRPIALWSFLVSYGAALLGAALYFLRANETVAMILPEGHKYEQLLVICIVVLVVGFVATFLGIERGQRVAQP
ncbi:sodium:proline symporter [Falsihalocynthiibacter arcticus]|uniref:Sodium:proline symporter n=1 Tax=Falsihalocynthiibacter arcticus TaxID=1579316 RepID=A0A126V4J1_9RHOB|nr:sodium:proline symporter [Falsihalocynthiibacter arcticus]AML53193.1 sodium:proline symporter [Falsihalocynthiibacter arcticus]